MDFTLSDDQRSLRDLAARIFDDACSDEAIRAFADSGQPYDAVLWRTLAEAGLLGVALSEAGGGLGLGMIELGLLLEEQGRTLAPVPLTGTVVLAAWALDAHGSAAQRAWLPRILAGEAIVAVAIEEVGGVDPAQPGATADADGNGWRLSGVKYAVPYGAEAEALLVTATTADGPALFLVDPGGPGVAVAPQRSTSGEPQALVTLDRAPVAGDALVGGGSVVTELVQRAQVALALRQVGLAGEALRRTADYSSNRIQFGKLLGSMQAVQQRAADAFIDVEAMRSTALLAAWQIDQCSVQPADIATAKYWAAIGGHRVVHAAQHLHGGMGADITYPIHRYFLAATQIGEALGGASPMLAAIGAAVASGQTEPLA
ncbi:acyl-CoA dehydrogenase family protein [Sphingomonas sanxanigenens]|uniref:Acyl-CoA dehydrogenase n=1 Tax=Sphingomonas sanxanigenens DSM 19645 = NX02 TaxID=1123269 RepID=W0AEZ0_9SPHN|nr:acyl-CoA dehydrogenase family protein [Sphingomonas sanxanigenens]AHE55087.1 acyl-CoA dehydrogenase [Sphingomonas sanxanigenens DSM 19645 = NX02]